jgi:hypothetical protein
MVNEDGLLEWWDEKRISRSCISIGSAPVCHVTVGRRREKKECWVAHLSFYVASGDSREEAKEHTQAFFDQNSDIVLRALAIVRAAEDEFSDRLNRQDAREARKPSDLKPT